MLYNLLKVEKHKSFSTLKRKINMFKSKQLWSGILLSIILIGGALVWTKAAQSGDVYSTIKNNFYILSQIYQEVSRRYVDKIDPEKFLKAGIEGMLGTLDPYTTYIEKDEKSQLQIITHGNYGGVGMPLNFRNKVVTVADPPFLGTPSYRAGIRAGDKIIEVDGVTTKELGFEETVKRIRGKPGTEVTLTISRGGESELLDFTLIREQIKVPVLRYAGVLKDDIGYIRLTQFSKNAGQEVKKELLKLKEKNIRAMIFDLRSNPGGLLEIAVEIADLFLPQNEIIVSSRGRNKKIDHFISQNKPIIGDGPLVVLVNRNSASASEIVAGAIQDHDRGVVLGDTTFGKGLVQTVIQLSPNEALKITTAKYYTPSGRCIQKQNYSIWNDSTEIDTTIKYRTDNDRPVSGGGGIIPDVIVHYPEVSNLVWDLRRKSHYFNFAVKYVNTHTIVDSNFQIDKEIFNDFKTYLDDKSYVYQHPIEKDLEIFRKEAEEKEYDKTLLENIEHLQLSLNKTKENIFQNSEEEIKQILRIELASKFFGTRREVEISLENDPVIQKAIELLGDKELYVNILNSEN
jgi:carboxyl-terminal processing protease